MQSNRQRRSLGEFDFTWTRPQLGVLPHLETFTWQILTPAEEGLSGLGRLTCSVNVIKIKWKIIWTGGLPHLPGVHHLHINRSLDFAWGSHSGCSLPELTVKWATQTYNLFSNIAAKLVKKMLQTVLQQIRSYRLRKVVAESREEFYFLQRNVYILCVLLAQGQQTWHNLTPCMAWIQRNFIQSGVSVHATCDKLICCKASLNVSGKTRNAFQLVLQQCFQTSCTFLLPVLP